MLTLRCENAPLAHSSRPRWALAFLLSLAQVSGCSHSSPPAIPALPPLPREGAAAPPRVNGAIGSPEALPPADVAYGAQGDTAAGSPGQTLSSEQGPGNI